MVSEEATKYNYTALQLAILFREFINADAAYMLMDGKLDFTNDDIAETLYEMRFIEKKKWIEIEKETGISKFTAFRRVERLMKRKGDSIG